MREEPDIYDSVKSSVVRRFLKRWKMSADAEADNRERGLYALRFAQGGDSQWEDKMLSYRKEDNRPYESYNQIPNFIHQVTNDLRMNMAQTRFLPNEDVDKEAAEVREDLARTIQAENSAQIAYDTAGYNSCVVGWGYWRYVTEYCDDNTFDQKICIRWVPNTFTVYDDPFCTQPDKLDRQWLIEVTDMQLDDFNSDYTQDAEGKNIEYDPGTLQSIGDDYPDWATNKTVRVAEGWEIKNTKSMLYRHKKTGVISKDKPKDPNNYDSREVTIPKVMWYKFTAQDVLEKKEWQGKYIPYVYIVGEEINIDGQWKRYGIVERMIPAQRQMNYWTNTATELAMLAPKTPAIADPEAIGPYQKFWDQANVRSFPYLPYRSRDAQGNALPMPQRLQNSADLGSAMQLVQMAQQNFYNTSGIYPASLGRESNEKSGRAIIARQKEGDVSTFHISDNFSRGLLAGGKILDDLITIYYDGSRSVMLTKEDKTTRTVPINQPHIDEKTGQPKNYDMTKGSGGVQISTGPSYSTKRQESNEFYMALAQSVPQIMEIGGDIIVSSSDAAGADKLAERLKKALPPQFQDEQPNQIPPQLQAQLQQMQQVIQQQGQELQQAQQELQSKQADIASKGADIQLKQQQMAQDAQSNASQNQLDAAKLQIDQQKIELEREKIEFQREEMAFEERRLQVSQALDMTKTRMDAKVAMAQASPDIAMTDPELNEGNPPIVGIMGQLSQIVQQTAEQIVAMTAGSQAIAQSNIQLAQSNQDIAAAIAAPKTVVRVNGQITGVK